MTPSRGLIVESVRKMFDGRAILTNVSFSVPPGSICALVGENGAGKSTLLNLCLGYISPDEGTISIGGADLRTQPALARKKAAYIPDVARLYPNLSAIENLSYFESLRGSRVAREQCLVILDRLHFPPDAVDLPARTYSKGMRQKVSLAMGILKNAEVFLLDEPSSGLDSRSADELLLILRDVADRGNAVLFSTHHSELVRRIADMVANLEDGALSWRTTRLGDRGVETRSKDECSTV